MGSNLKRKSWIWIKQSYNYNDFNWSCFINNFGNIFGMVLYYAFQFLFKKVLLTKLNKQKVHFHQIMGLHNSFYINNWCFYEIIYKISYDLRIRNSIFYMGNEYLLTIFLNNLSLVNIHQSTHSMLPRIKHVSFSSIALTRII